MSNDTDRTVLAAVFAARVSLAKKAEDRVIAEALEERKKTIAWVQSPATGPKSFVWFCEVFDLDPSVVRRAIKENRA